MTPLLDVQGLSKHYPVGGGERGLLTRAWSAWRRPGVPAPAPSRLYAVDDVSFSVARGECLGIVGESGCGKSTLVRLLTRLIDPTSGRVFFDGHDIGAVPSRSFARSIWRGRIQQVFQDPLGTLSPRFTAADAIAEPLRRLRGRSETNSRARLRERVEALADLVGLPRPLLTRYPHQLSGGQLARVGIARALAPDPTLLVLDEPTSALDVSVQAAVLQTLDRLRRELGVTCLFVCHELNVVRLMCDRVMVMYLGKVVEEGPAAQVFDVPRHPYTQALLSAAPELDLSGRGHESRRLRLEGEPRSPVDPSPHTCRFFGRCPAGQDECDRQMPPLVEVGPGHRSACHFAAQVGAVAG